MTRSSEATTLARPTSSSPGFTQIGMAPTYLHIDGHWQDCNLYQRILNNREPGA